MTQYKERNNNGKFDFIRFYTKTGTLNAEVFSAIAEKAAEKVANSPESKNKSTQLRKFYDEFCMWHEKVGSKEENFEKYLPFIKMMKAKVAYSEGRKLVDINFVNFFNKLIDNVKTVESFDHSKLFFEAFMGFYKSYKG